MIEPYESSQFRAAVNSPRATVVAIVSGMSAAGGMVAGGVAALIGAAVLTPSEPVSAMQISLMAAEYGVIAGLAGAVLGTLVGFGALRRVALGRLVLSTNAGLAAGLVTAWLGGPWAWHHMGILGLAGFSAGAVLARITSRDSSGNPQVGKTSSEFLGSGPMMESHVTGVDAKAAPGVHRFG